MRENYSGDDASGASPAPVAARELIGRLLPGMDVALVVAALAAEYAAGPPRDPSAADDGASDPAVRELRRVRRQFAVGAAAIDVQHDLSNPLTALLAEAQLLELEPLSVEHRAAARRIVELARRVAAAARRLEGAAGTAIG